MSLADDLKGQDLCLRCFHKYGKHVTAGAWSACRAVGCICRCCLFGVGHAEFCPAFLNEPCTCDYWPAGIVPPPEE